MTPVDRFRHRHALRPGRLAVSVSLLVLAPIAAIGLANSSGPLLEVTGSEAETTDTFQYGLGNEACARLSEGLVSQQATEDVAQSFGLPTSVPVQDGITLSRFHCVSVTSEAGDSTVLGVMAVAAEGKEAWLLVNSAPDGPSATDWTTYLVDHGFSRDSVRATSYGFSTIESGNDQTTDLWLAIHAYWTNESE